MNYDWYKIINRDDFLATGLASKELVLDLEDLGQKTVVVFLGNEISLRCDDVYIPVQFNSENPFALEGNASYIDANGDIWLGFPSEN